MIKLSTMDHVCLRVGDVDAAATRWAVQFGLSEAERGPGRIALRCAYEPYSLELLEGSGGPAGRTDHTAYQLAAETTLEQASKHLQALGIEHRRDGDALRLSDPEGNGIELIERRAQADRRPAVARATTTLAAFHPRRLGHVNYLCRDLAGTSDFYRLALGMEVSDELLGAGTWFHINADHHVLALVSHERAHFHHLAFELVDWGELRVALDHLGQHGRWLVWGPLRHGLGQNLSAYVRIPEEECMVELYSDMEQLPADHLPRQWPDDAHSSNTWGIMPPRSYFRFDGAAIESEREGREARGIPLPPLAPAGGGR